jgi:tRNA A37 threonylcarbamoyladenosine dehydratase
MMKPFERTQLLLGPEALGVLSRSSVAIFGIGGVGSFAAEAIARSGVGRITLFDNDTVSISNLNRQLVALHSTIGRSKADVMRDRILDINPEATVTLHAVFYGAENAAQFDFSQYDYIIDAIDSVSSKLILIQQAKASGVPVISCMGAGNKLDPTAFEVADISKTSVCPLAKVMRHELRARGIDSLKVVYSKENPISQSIRDAHASSGETVGTDPAFMKKIPGSVPFVPSVAGLILAGEVIKDLIHHQKQK